MERIPEKQHDGMIYPLAGNNKPGGEHMKVQEVSLGQVIYEVSLVFSGTRPATELLTERLEKLAKNTPIDDKHDDAL